VKRVFIAAFCLLATGLAARQHFDGKTLWHHVEVLAADDMEGRGTGTPGLERAQAYVIDQLKRIGLASAGVSGFMQPVPLLRREVDNCSAALVREDRVAQLTLGEDAACTTFLDNAPSVEAPLVFLGYGLKVPDAGYDEFRGLELKGKIAVTIAGSPPGIDGALLAESTARRWDQFREAGLIGWIFIPGPAARWAALAASAAGPRLHLTGDFDETHGEKLMLYFNPAHGDKLFDGTGHSVSELFQLASERKPLPRFALPLSVRATTRMVNTPVASSNVLAKLEGSDRQLKNEYVVLSAHLDHLGIANPVNGDRIYNGALDNAAGVAALLDLMNELKREGARPKRSTLLQFSTAEEHGALGSKYFVARPTVTTVVANIDVDNMHFIVPLKEMAVLGIDESDLGDAARRAAASQNIPADAEPQLHSPYEFPSDDHGSFVLAGIPAIALKIGFPGELAPVLQQYRQSPYHTPFDDTHQAIDMETIAKFEEVLRALLLDVANAPHRPQWKSSSVYRLHAQ